MGVYNNWILGLKEGSYHSDSGCLLGAPEFWKLPDGPWPNPLKEHSTLAIHIQPGSILGAVLVPSRQRTLKI